MRKNKNKIKKILKKIKLKKFGEKISLTRMEVMWEWQKIKQSRFKMQMIYNMAKSPFMVVFSLFFKF